MLPFCATLLTNAENEDRDFGFDTNSLPHPLFHSRKTGTSGELPTKRSVIWSDKTLISTTRFVEQLRFTVRSDSMHAATLSQEWP